MSGDPTFVHDFLSASAARSPEKSALIAGPQTRTFGALDAESRTLARGLQDLGIARGDRVAILMENSVELVTGVFAALKAGAVFVVINPTTKAPKLRYILNDCRVSVLVAGRRLRPVVEEATRDLVFLKAVVWAGPGEDGTVAGASFEALLAETAGDLAPPGLVDEDLCTIVYTSGSTGDPKGVMLTHRNMTNTAWSISTYLENTADDVVICFLPLSFDYGLYQVITGARVGFTVVLERSFAFPYDILRRMDAERVTGLPGVPTVFALLLELDRWADFDLSSLRYVSNTGAAFPPAHIRRLQEALPQVKVFSMYGLTECTRVSYLDPGRLPEKINSVGKAMPNSEVYVVNDDGSRASPEAVGELVVRGANVMRGYWGDPRRTAERLRDGEIVGEKVLHTGDLFYTDDEGFLYFVGRKDDIFKCKGEKISPKEIENVLYTMDDVAEAAVIGVEDPIDGHAVKAVVVPRAGCSLEVDRIRLHCRANLENYMVPKFIEVRESIPKSASGKLLKKTLAE